MKNTKNETLKKVLTNVITYVVVAIIAGSVMYFKTSIKDHEILQNVSEYNIKLEDEILPEIKNEIKDHQEETKAIKINIEENYVTKAKMLQYDFSRLLFIKSVIESWPAQTREEREQKERQLEKINNFIFNHPMMTNDLISNTN